MLQGGMRGRKVSHIFRMSLLAIFYLPFRSKCKSPFEYNVDENDGSCQFHQRFTRKFFIRIIRQSQNVTRKSCQKRLSYEKIRAYNVDEIDASKRSSSSSPTSHAQHHSSSRSCGSRGDIRARRYVSSCLNKFTRSFYAHRSQKHKLTDDLTAFFALLGSTRVKAARKHVVEIDPFCQFQQHFMSSFCSDFLSTKNYKPIST